MIPVLGKSFFIYDTIIKDTIKILFDNIIEENNIPNNIIIDLEKIIQKTI